MWSWGLGLHGSFEEGDWRAIAAERHLRLPEKHDNGLSVSAKAQPFAMGRCDLTFE